MTNTTYPNRQHKQAGLGLISAIFLMVVVTLLTVAVARSVRSSADIRNMDVLGSRALQVAESGAQLGVHRAVTAGVCAADTIDFGSLAPDWRHPNCQATISCAATTAGGLTMYHIESEGLCRAGPTSYMQRTVSAIVQ